jgi:NDP-sugar pyrophosphorylase family protein
MSRRAVILSGGLGTRLKPFTEVIPKPLLPVGEKAVLEIQIERFREFGFEDIFLATNYKSTYIENFFGDGSRYGVRLTVSKEDEPLGTAGPLKLLQGNLQGDPFIVMNGDILTLADLSAIYEFASSKESLLTICVKKVITPYAFGNIVFDEDLVVSIEEKPDLVTFALAGLYIMKPPILDRIPPAKYYGMDKLIRHMLEEGLPIHKYEITDYWLDIGRVEDYQAAQLASGKFGNDEKK